MTPNQKDTVTEVRDALVAVLESKVTLDPLPKIVMEDVIRKLNRIINR